MIDCRAPHAPCWLQGVGPALLSMSHPGVFWRAGPGSHQHHRPGLRPPLPAVPAVSTGKTDLHTWQVGHPQHVHIQWHTHTHICSFEFHDQTTFFPSRVLNMEELPWTEEEEESAEHPYYNNIPGKMPPPGGFIDTRLTNHNAAPDGSQVQPSFCGFICLFCLCILLSQSNQIQYYYLRIENADGYVLISQKVLNRIAWNLVGWLVIIRGPFD